MMDRLQSKSLFFLVFIEGYAVLALELLAIRQLVPLVGNGADSISIVIAAVLLPLSFGYYYGGHASGLKERQAILAKVSRNVVMAMVLTGVGLSFYMMNLFFYGMQSVGLVHPLAQTAVYCCVVLAPAIFWLGQTIPLLSSLLPKASIETLTGKLLFFSTLGSFAGSILSTLVFMSFFGVSMTLMTVMVFLLFALFMMQDRLFSKNTAAVVCMFLCVLSINHPSIEKSFNLMFTNAYSSIRQLPIEDGVIMSVNGTFSSKFPDEYDENKQFKYVQLINRSVLKPLEEKGALNVLVIGAAGFNVGGERSLHQYMFVDIDPDMQKVAEEHFRKNPLPENKTFVAAPARSYLKQTDAQYDVIILDAYSSIHGTPIQLITLEFFTDVKAHLKPDGLVVFNTLSSPTFSDKASRKLDRTFRQIFPYSTRQVVANAKGLNLAFDPVLSNIIYVAYPYVEEVPAVYTDDLNGYVWDR